MPPQNAWRCSQCGAINEPGSRACQACGKWPSLFDLQDNVVDEVSAPVVAERPAFEPETVEPEPFETKTFEPAPVEAEELPEEVGTPETASDRRRRILTSLRPDRFEDIVAVIALYRPGPMGEIPHYIEGKHHPSKVRFLHPSLEDILRDTHGVIVYQEQIIQILQRIAGYSPGEADIVRKAIGKKKEDLMKAHAPKFIDGAKAQGLTEDQARHLWDLIQPFAGYSFNRAHAACYGLVAYQTAYLKAHHPIEYMSALLTSVRDSKDDKTKYLAAARKMGVQVLAPDVNRSEAEFAPDPTEQEAIRFGLTGVRNVGEGAVEHILSSRRQEGVFSDFFDFCWRVDVSVLNKRIIESLIKAGAFDEMGHTRGGLLEVFEQITEQISSARRKEKDGYVSLFDDPSAASGNGERTLVGSSLTVPQTDLAKEVALAFEKEMLGQYVTDHPLLGLEQVLAAQTDTAILSLPERPDGAVVSVAGIVNKVGKKFTRKGELMLLVDLEDLEAGCEVIVFPAVAEKAAGLVEIDKVLWVKARVDHKEETPKLVALEIAEPDRDILDHPLRLTVDEKRCTPQFVDELKEVLREHPGSTPVFLHLRSEEKMTVLRLGSDLRVDPENGCVDRLRAMLGGEAVRIAGS
jgi:DNA polymerase III subunit alpha